MHADFFFWKRNAILRKDNSLKFYSQPNQTMAKKKKTSSPFALGQSVRLRDEHAEKYLNMGIPDGYGTFLEIDGEGTFLALDAEAILLLADQWLAITQEHGAPCWEVPVDEDFLEPAPVRTFPLSKEEAISIIEKRIDSVLYMLGKLELEQEEWGWGEVDNDVGPDFGLETQTFGPSMEAWAKEFARSHDVRKLPRNKREHAEHVAFSFMSHAWQYERERPKDFDQATVQSLLLDLIPKQLTAEPDFFKSYPEILIKFFWFMEQKGEMKNVAGLCTLVDELKGTFFERSQDASNWGPAKTVAMGMMAEGIALEDKEAIRRHIDKYNQSLGGQ
ncbi:MAG: hypothetical protein D6722_28065 [Bacteroidetes bacterium]|nr:MAG: hypothetical protein D6722_28065 [Bacteroidota bacterium]